VFSVCAICRGAAAPGHPICWSCHVVRGQLGRELTRAVPVSLFAPFSPLHKLLVGYKAAPAARARREWQAALSELLENFFRLHLSCLAGGGLAAPGRRENLAVLAVPVPSSSEPRASWKGQHPLIGLLAEAVLTEPRLVLAPRLVKGTQPVGHLRADLHGFRVVGPVSGSRVLVLDDTYTSGARSQSAAATLAAAGADVRAIVPIGRLIHPDHNRSTAKLWAEQWRQPFDLGRCACPCLQGRAPSRSGQLGIASSRPGRRQTPAMSPPSRLASVTRA